MIMDEWLWKRDSVNALILMRRVFYICTYLLGFCESIVSKEKSWSEKFHFGVTFTFLTLIPQKELNNQPHSQTAPIA